MKYLLFVIVFLSDTVSFGQSIEDRIALKACECLGTKKVIDDAVYRDCVSKNMAEVILGDSDPKVREKFNTVEGITSMWEKMNEIIPKNCEHLKKGTAELKKGGTYSASKIESAQGAYIIGKDFMEDKKYSFAIESFKMAVKRDNNFVLAYDDMALCYRLLDNLDEAIKYYKKSLEIYPEGDFALMNIGVAYSKKSDFKTAIKYYEKLIQFYPDNAEGYFGAGKNYALLNDYENGLKNLFRAHKIYTFEKSEYKDDSEQLIGIVYNKMKDENKEELFKEIAKKNDIKFE